ncbi:MAG: LuxR C-terminal-related transcriptional regulator, partial [Chloroflexota bacterium]
QNYRNLDPACRAALVMNKVNNLQIGEQLHLATYTVRNHLSQVIGKLNVFNRTQATVKAVQVGLVDW